MKVLSISGGANTEPAGHFWSAGNFGIGRYDFSH